MKIFDLTRGASSMVYDSLVCLGLQEKMREASHNAYLFYLHFCLSGEAWEETLDAIPVFLVDKTMANEYIAVPGCQSSVRVPEDSFVGPVCDDFDIDAWVNSKEGWKKDDPRERVSTAQGISDLLGIYVYTSENDLIPRRIFIWVDKIIDCVRKYAKNDKDVEKYAGVLFELVLFHEMGHALMDVELYKIHPAPDFSYAGDYVYRFIEEACADAFALDCLFGQEGVPSSLPHQFIHDFVCQQGVDFYEHHSVKISQWMAIKVLFNFEFALLLRKFWKDKRNVRTLNCIKSVSHRGWIAVKDHNDKWGIIETKMQQSVWPRKYDYIWSFDENGLCKVRLDQQHGDLYGYVDKQGNEQIPVVYDYLYSFENGLTVAKKNDKYGIIDVNNNVNVPFGLPYDEVREFRDGLALVKNSCGKWGKIDTNGKIVAPCTNDSVF